MKPLRRSRISPRVLCPKTVVLLVALARIAHSGGDAQVTDWRLQLSSSGEIAAGRLPKDAPGYVGPRVEPDQWQGFAKLPPRVRANLNALSVNVRANDPTGDAGPPAAETQSEVAVAAWNQYVVVAWNDSKGFTAGFTLSSFAYSSNYGQSFIDGGNVPLIAGADQAFGDCTLGVDDLGNFYLGSIYTTGANQDCAVLKGGFSGSLFSWNTPVIAAVSTAADKPSIAVDPYDNYVYCAYTDFAGGTAIKVVTSSNQGATWSAPVTLSTASGASGARPWVGPDHEVYVVWEEGWGFINCDLSSTTGSIVFSASTNHGGSWSAASTIASVTHNWTSYGPGDIRGRAREFPDIAIDRSSGAGRKTVYVLWNEAATYGAPGAGTGVSVAEGNNTTNDLPSGATAFNLGDNLTGSVSVQANNDYFKVNLTQGQHCLFRLEPQGFNCGISGTTRDMLIRLYPTPANLGVSPPDTLLAYSELNGFASQIHFDCPKTGTYYLRIRGGTETGGVYTGTYTVKSRALTYTSPSGTTPARDQRDIVMVRRPGGAGAWSSKLRVNDDPANLDNSLPFITCDATGKVHAFWFDARESGNPGATIQGAGALTDIYVARSDDHGVSFAANQRVSDESSLFNFNTAAIPNRGDYNSAYSAGMRVYAAWSDERLSNGAGTGVDAFTARIDTEVQVDCPTSLTLCPCDAFNRTFTIHNVGNVEGDIHYSITDSLGWCAALTGTVHLVGGASTTVNYSCAAPCSLKNGASNKLTAIIYPVIDPVRADTCASRIIVTPGAMATLVCPPDTAGSRGDSLHLAFRITNTGGCSDRFRYRLLDDRGWFTAVNDSVMIGPGDSALVRAHGQVPDTLNGAATDMLHLIAYPLSAGAQADTCHTAVTVHGPTGVPGAAVTAYRLLASTPNPAALHATFAFELPQAGEVTIHVFDAHGRLVRTVLDRRAYSPGRHSERWDLRSDGGERVPPGIYFYRMLAGRFAARRAMVVLK